MIKKKSVAKYPVNRFVPYIIYNIIFLTLFAYAFFVAKTLVNPILAYSVLVFLIMTIIKDIMLLLFEYIEMTNLDKEFIIQKSIFGINFSKKIIKKPFEIEISYNIKSKYYLGRSSNSWTRFYHKRGLKFFDKSGKTIYEVGLNDNMDAEKIFELIK